MSEYQEKHTVSRLIGAPPGYVGYDEAGQLTEAIRRRPYAVLLFDEIEKAHPEVLNVMLQLLDDGRLTDGKGRVVDFKNTVVVMTSNLRDLDALRGHFRPEFINRIDEIVFFHSLEREHIRQIIEIQLRNLLKRLDDRKITVELTDAAKDFLVREGYDPVYGARPLKRALQRRLLDPLALRVLDGAFGEGDTVVVNLAGDELSFTKGHAVHA
jgi:ATP-dependent Clp protease ATP-binding subunit ClpB